MPPRPEPEKAPAAPFQRLAASRERVAVTGATGWFGRVALDLLAHAMGAGDFHSRVVGYASRATTVDVVGAGRIALRPLTELEPAEVLLHFAFLTQGRAEPADHDTYVAANLAITSRVLSVLATGNVRRLLVTSSGAARDPDLARNPYGALKRIDELAFTAACQDVDAACAMVRVFNVGGQHMTHPEAYALGDLILRAQAGRPLEIAASGEVVRSYVAVGDVLAVALGELMAGRGTRFDTAGERSVEIEELAHVVLAVLGRNDLEVSRERDPGAAPSVYVGDGERLRALARENGIVPRDLEAIVAETASGLAGRGAP